MSYFTDEIRIIVNREEYPEALKLLAYTLQYGTKQLQEQIKRLSQRITASPQTSSSGLAFNPKATLLTFLDFLEKKESAQLRFLSHLLLAEEKFRSGDWKEAKLNFELAGKLHLPLYALSIAELNQKSRLCDEALAFNQYIETGNNFFAVRSWENAGMSYQQALKTIREEFGYDTTELHKTLRLCSQGLRFDQNMDMARGYESQKIWNEAKMAYSRALELYDEAFLAEKKDIEAALIRCAEHKQKNSPQTPSFRLSIVILNLCLLAATLFMIIYFAGKS
ncbi:MAG: hypothetical protein SF052_08330 [Bacteroidia bacterium]|nr:hypothetical protein [Bacteroidia bacterium]